MALEEVIHFLVPISAFGATLLGMIVITHFFKNKIKELFNDTNYFIFFFLAVGYTLYALGELSWYLMYEVAAGGTPKTVADVYWTGGAIAILLSFIALSKTLHKEFGDRTKLYAQLGIGLVLFLVVIIYLLGGGVSETGYFFSYFYPIMSSLATIFALSIVLFYQQIKQLKRNLLYLFFASLAILCGDMLFAYVSSRGIFGSLGTISDLFYLAGYSLSAVFFLVMLFGFYNRSLEE